MKNGKEVKVTTFKNYGIVYGSVDNRHSKAVYINISAWAEPKDDDLLSYSRVIKDINKKVKQTVFNLLDNEDETQFKKQNTIVDLDIRESGIRYGKRSFTNCEITLFLNYETPVNSETMKEKLDLLTEKVISQCFESNKTFKFHKKKS